MSTKVDGVAYTNQGNSYQKTNAGKKAGFALGVAVPAALSFVPYKTSLKLYSKILPKDSFILENMKEIATYGKNPIQVVKAFCKGDMNKYIFKGLEDVPKDMIPKFIKKLQTSKGARMAYMAIVTGIGFAIWANVGKLIGAGVDKIVNLKRAAEIDKAV